MKLTRELENPQDNNEQYHRKDLKQNEVQLTTLPTKRARRPPSSRSDDFLW
jgi:hypothetical protein